MKDVVGLSAVGRVGAKEWRKWGEQLEGGRTKGKAETNCTHRGAGAGIDE